MEIYFIGARLANLGTEKIGVTAGFVVMTPAAKAVSNAILFDSAS